MRMLVSAALAACVLLFATPAGATDPNFLLPPPKANEEVWRFNRTAAYFGVIGGYDSAQFQADSFKYADATWMAGLFGGFNVRVNDGLMLGIEADYMLTDIKATTTDGFVTLVAQTKYLASLRARAGLPVGPALFYVTAGPAITKQELTIAAAGLASDEFKVGLAAGGGVEASLTRNLIVRVEALHYVFPDKDVGFLESKDQQTTFRVGLGFKLN